MSLKAAIYNRATTHAGLDALIDGRMRPDVAEQEDTAPYVVYQIISTTRFPTFGAAATLAEARVQFDSFATTSLGAVNLAAQVKSAYDRWQGTFASQEILDSLIDDERDLTELLDTETELRRVSQDFMIAYRE